MTSHGSRFTVTVALAVNHRAIIRRANPIVQAPDCMCQLVKHCMIECGYEIHYEPGPENGFEITLPYLQFFVLTDSGLVGVSWV